MQTVRLSIERWAGDRRIGLVFFKIARTCITLGALLNAGGGIAREFFTNFVYYGSCMIDNRICNSNK